jgi:diguanylate cyclase (GGDEF)-like protein
MTTRNPDNLVAQLDDGRIVNVSYRPTQNGCWVSTHEDITERAQNEARIAHLAFHDQLTGLPNRAAFNERIANTLPLAAGNASFAVLCVDVDQFKEINDVYGHSTGDRFLVEVGHRLNSACNGSFLARLGADEFIVVSPDGPQPATAQEFCAHLGTVLDRPVCIDGYEIESSLTIGASVYPRDGADADTLAASAETALYRAKAYQRGSTTSAQRWRRTNWNCISSPRPCPMEDLRFRGAATLAASAARLGASRAVHSAGGRDRRDRPDR